MFFSRKSNVTDTLFALRNKVVKLFGLKTSGEVLDRQKLVENSTFEPGQQLGLFKVYDKTENELVVGQDDKHLDFRVSLLVDSLLDGTSQKHLTITTAVTFHNRFGRFYFFLVKPFHKWIVPGMLKGMIERIENSQLPAANLV
ncbi:hypothetical protein GCM10023183_23650 [Nibribacter koreensis]|uniref:DUF2867 domain-containing protein n=2 Tax=Nibribacter koreensis TaxID=1084519 RepID=A0ABP8FND2_9BACT